MQQLSDYVFTDFSQELENLNMTHPHRVRREPNITHVDEYAKRELININPELFQQHIQGWSRSYYNLNKHMEAILNYGTRDIPMTALNIPVYIDSIMAVDNWLSSLPRVRAINVLTDLDQVPYKTSTAAGYNYIGAKGPYHGANHMKAIGIAKAAMWAIHESGVPELTNAIINSTPDVGYTRTQLADLTEKTKIRNVWGRAFHYILLEGLFAQPLIETFSKHETFYHVGRDPLVSVPELFSKALRFGKWLYAVDWKQFDATVSRFEIDAAFTIIEKLIDFPNAETQACFYLCKQIFIHKKIAAPDGNTYWSHKGIPSGSYFTSIIGSIVNRLRIEYMWKIAKGRGPALCYTQGDDSLCSDPDLVRPETFQSIADSVGWIFNAGKTEYSRLPGEVTFLGRTSQGGFNARSTIKCLRLLIYPEYPVTEGRIASYRAKSIYEDCGQMSEIIGTIAKRLDRQYGTISEEEVPSHFKRYVMH
jgi:hypothetical protein